jgi:hypothetical protein
MSSFNTWTPQRHAQQERSRGLATLSSPYYALCILRPKEPKLGREKISPLLLQGEPQHVKADVCILDGVGIDPFLIIQEENGTCIHSMMFSSSSWRLRPPPSAPMHVAVINMVYLQGLTDVLEIVMSGSWPTITKSWNCASW